MNNAFLIEELESILNNTELGTLLRDAESEFSREAETFSSFETESEKGKSCPPHLPYKHPPAAGQLSKLPFSKHGLFLPKYRTYPSNIWSLARAVRARMVDFKGTEEGLPRVSQIVYGIRNHPNNSYLKRKWFLPRFKSDRCTPGGNYYGVIYIPFKF